MQKILVAHDGSKSSDKALKKAVELTAVFKGPLTVLSVIPELYLTELQTTDRNRISESISEQIKNVMEKIEKSMAGKATEVRTLVRKGDPAEIIIETAQKMGVDLIVTGSHGKHGAKKFHLGSVSAKVVKYARCPVLVVK